MVLILKLFVLILKPSASLAFWAFLGVAAPARCRLAGWRGCPASLALQLKSCGIFEKSRKIPKIHKKTSKIMKNHGMVLILKRRGDKSGDGFNIKTFRFNIKTFDSI